MTDQNWKITPPQRDPQGFSVGERVLERYGECRFEGEVVAAFTKRNGQWRYVVENEYGVLHVFTGHQLVADQGES